MPVDQGDGGTTEEKGTVDQLAQQFATEDAEAEHVHQAAEEEHADEPAGATDDDTDDDDEDEDELISPAAGLPTDVADALAEEFGTPDQEFTVIEMAEVKEEEKGIADRIIDGLDGTARVIHSVLPDRLAFYITTGVFVAISVLEPPIAAISALTYEGLRRWNPQGSEKTRG